MSKKLQQHPASIDDTQALRELHQLYLGFLAGLAEGRSRDSLRLTYSQFAEWWSGLDPATRQMLESDLRKGRAALVEEGERQVAMVIARYESCVEEIVDGNAAQD